jgi:hypothetical protein
MTDTPALPDWLSVRFGTDPVTGRRIVVEMHLKADHITGGMVRSIPFARIEADANATPEDMPTLPPLARPAALPPAEFSQLVADHYRAWAARSATPVAEMARVSGIKSRTLHCWVREARLRGFLPPGRPTTRGRPSLDSQGSTAGDPS